MQIKRKRVEQKNGGEFNSKNPGIVDRCTIYPKSYKVCLTQWTVVYATRMYIDVMGVTHHFTP